MTGGPESGVEELAEMSYSPDTVYGTGREVDDLIDGYEEWAERMADTEHTIAPHNSLPREVSPEAVDSLLLYLEQDDNPDRSIFASFAINRMDTSDFYRMDSQKAKNLGESPGPGFANSANVLIKRDSEDDLWPESNLIEQPTFDSVGERMQGGKLVVDGRASKAGKEMTGGTLEIYQAEKLAEGMDGGTAISRSYTGSVARGAESGTCLVYGDVGEAGLNAGENVEIYVTGSVEEIGSNACVYQWEGEEPLEPPENGLTNGQVLELDGWDEAGGFGIPFL